VSRSRRSGGQAKGPLRDNAPALAVLFGAHMVGSMTFITFATMASFIREDLSLSATQFGFLVSCYFAAQGILALPIGATIDRIGVRNALALANLTLFSGALMLALATGMTGALAGMAVLGIGYCFVNPSTSKAVFELFPAQRLGTAMGIKQTGVPIGGVLGASVGGLAGTFDWRWLMAGVGLSALFFAASALLLGRPKHNPEKKAASLATHLRNMRQVIADRNLTIFNVASGFYQAGQANLFSYITLFARETMLASQPVAASCLGIAQLASASGRMTWGMVSDFVFRGRRRPVLIIMSSIAILGLVMFAVMTRSWTVAAIIPVAIILGLTVSGHVALVQTVVVEMANPAYTATSVAYNRLFVSLGASIGPPLFGAAVDYSGGYGAGWLVTAGMVFIALLIFACVFRERGQA
jgi:MFS transporter, ACS family, hexuronate transporter